MDPKVKMITREDVAAMAAMYEGEEFAKLAEECNAVSALTVGKRPDALLATMVCQSRDRGASIQGFIANLVPFVIFIWESMDTSEVKSVGQA